MPTSTAHRSLSRDEVLDQAVRMARRDGLGGVSARRLASRLGVTPMALYRYVEDMDEVAAAVVDALLADEGLPEVATGDWQGWLAEMAAGLRRLFAAQPAALELFAHRPVATPTACRRLSATVEVLVAAGFDVEGATRAYAAVHTYTLGFSALAAARQTPPDRRRLAARAPATDLAPEVAAIVGFVNDEQFAHGLGALLAGLAPTPTATGEATSG